MKFFRRYIFPALYGLLAYFTIRLLTDSVSGMRFWQRSWTLNGIEMAFSVMMGYVFIYAYHRLFAYYDQRWQDQFPTKRIRQELLGVFLINLLVQNIFMTPMVALTDDGLQFFDLIDVNIIPLFYAFIYYGVKRSHAYMQAYIHNRMQLEKITTDKLETELKFLRAQYHPHFLFNALNTIYFQMDDDVVAAKKTVEQFADLLRYQLYDQQETVNISQEIQYMQQFIDLQKIRSSTRLQLQLHFDEQLKEEKVYPLLFLPLVENAFKYMGGDYLLQVELRKEGADIYFFVQNSIPETTPEIAGLAVAREKGIGLENLQRRLELLYPGKHRLMAGIREQQFVAELKLTLPT
ncbi:sensor histidine kinase [Chitinophaga qingshengii]|uniref:Histidine kinase n=1 Tax=Chitinophaga qingshengii TaxID=1569794 RepID=A0ABR7THR8_9BACT|nr:histidine kinase [Chitinophaga qingshengii]MBC9930061.1 histidine kinase [Chitinophaga qingshengii]